MNRIINCLFQTSKLDLTDLLTMPAITEKEKKEFLKAIDAPVSLFKELFDEDL